MKNQQKKQEYFLVETDKIIEKMEKDAEDIKEKVNELIILSKTLKDNIVNN